MEDIREKVKEKYAKAITTKSGCCDGVGSGAGCCGTSSSPKQQVVGENYNPEEISGLPEDILQASFGCGNPTALATVFPGETVLDLGSGAGLDAILASRRVGSYGKVYGLDMTDEMLDEARRNVTKAGVANVEFLKGHIEEIPLPDNSVDLIISNCVINLSADKGKVLREAFRVLRPGGRVAVSDVVVIKRLPDSIRMDISAWAGCIAGALSESEYRELLQMAGFSGLEIVMTRIYEFGEDAFPNVTLEERKALNGALGSAFVRAKKPSLHWQPGVDYIVRSAEDKDFEAITQLLTQSGLPVEGVREHLAKFIVADNGTIIGVLGREDAVEGAVLIRSLAVQSQYRKHGIADALLKTIRDAVIDNGVHMVYLFTNTAPGYFASRGFVEIPRSEIPRQLLDSSILSMYCPSTSMAMRQSNL